VQHSTQDSATDLVPSEFPKQLDIAQVSVCGLSFLSAGLFLFLPLVNLRHPSPWQRWIRTIHGIFLDVCFVGCLHSYVLASSISLFAVNLSNVRFDNGDKK
jgi:hypothetical protein